MIAGVVVAATIIITSSCKDQAMPWRFYHSLATNLVRALPGTCITFVVYENIAWLLKRAAARHEAG
ncbi:hypothetical protein EDB85DRAFT_2024289 [Lactarius pseudohatsudake]|nr:hypothetical protein EDB85DRAFT_2024289 [Lactarius pseudohatsudake]